MNPSLKTPYSYAVDFSLERDIGRGFTVEAAYVGNLGHRLLLKKDYGQYMGEFKDVQSGQTLWQAYNMLVKQMGSLTNQAPPSQITPIPWIQDLMPNMPAYAAELPGQSRGGEPDADAGVLRDRADLRSGLERCCARHG